MPSRPSEAELRRGEAATWGSPATTVKLRRWFPYRNPAGTQLAFLSVELPSGMIVNDIRLMVGAKGRRWLAMPSQKRTDGTGWSDFVEFRDKATRDRFQEPILAVAQREHPEAFRDEPP
jgi:DNA-binding cell septation regulator SpoVG